MTTDHTRAIVAAAERLTEKYALSAPSYCGAELAALYDAVCRKREAEKPKLLEPGEAWTLSHARIEDRAPFSNMARVLTADRASVLRCIEALPCVNRDELRDLSDIRSLLLPSSPMGE